MIAPVVMIPLIGNACRNRALNEPHETRTTVGTEPNEYSATIVRTIFDGAGEQTIVAREARSGEMRREEWTEGGQNRALIFRPDLGKTYLLDLDRQTYIENLLDADNLNNTSQKREDADSPSNLMQAVDRAIDDAPSPDRVETRDLSPAEIDGHVCIVQERRATFTDGHSETTKTYRAPDLAGLTLKSESYSEPAAVRVITERRDVSLSVASQLFNVPANFKRVDKIDTDR
jgi:hypothetical protein